MATVLAQSQSPFRLHIKQRPSRGSAGSADRGDDGGRSARRGRNGLRGSALTAYQPDRPALESERCVTLAGERPPPADR